MKLKTFLCKECRAIRAQELDAFIKISQADKSSAEGLYRATNTPIQAGMCLYNAVSKRCTPTIEGECYIEKHGVISCNESTWEM